jgi:2,3-bisphosphoglycerate-independent phosphoglycerate mutase
MKRAILVGDGMGDYPVDALGGKTPLQAASIPHIRRLSAAGRTRLVRTVPEGMAPGSDVANLSLLGYDPAANYTGRAPIEAAGGGVPMGPEDVAYRCNLVTIAGGRMEDYSAGHIGDEEAHELIAACNAEFEKSGLAFHPGPSYRHLLIVREGPVGVKTQPPHDIAGKAAADYLPSGAGAGVLRAMMERSAELFRAHPVNRARAERGEKPATQIWLWGQGKSMALPSYREKYGLGGGVITAVNLVKGLGKLAGLSAPDIEGATGFLDTNYEGKVEQALRILEREDFVYVHIEAPDECGHMGDVEKKIQAIEDFDRRVVGPLWRELERRGDPYRIVVTTDHRTPVSLRGHTAESVPMTIVEGPTGAVWEEGAFDEFSGEEEARLAWRVIEDLLR